MKDKKRIALWGPVLLAAVIVLLAFATGVLDKQHVFEDVEYSVDFQDGKRSFSLQDGDAYGVMTQSGTGYNLPAGTYRLKYMIDGDGENALHLSCANGAAITGGDIAIPAGGGWNEAEFIVEEACVDLRIDIEFTSGTYIDVVNLRMYSPFYNDNAWTLLFVAVGFSVLWVLGSTGRLCREQAGALIFIALALLIANGPAFKDTLNITPDTHFHLARVENLASGLASGQFPVRAGGYTHNGYGAITSVFYADVFLYPFALMSLLGASIVYVMNVYMVAVSVVSAAAMYTCARRMFGDRWMAVCASILYTLAIYRATNAYTRCAVGEVTAMAFLPLFILGLWEVVLGDKQRYVTLGVGAACIFLCHMISTLICAATAFFFCLFNVRRIMREKRLFSLFQAVGVALLLCAFQIVPFLMYSVQGIGAAELAKDVGYAAMVPAQLFALGTGNAIFPRNRHISWFSTEIGLPQLVGAALALYVLVMRGKRDKESRTVFALIIGGVCFSIGATSLFPWSYVSVLTGGLSDFIQFSWRLLMMVTVCFALAGGYGMVKFADSRPDAAAMFALCLAAVCTLPTLSREMRYDEYIEFSCGGDTAIHYLEYTLPGSDMAQTTQREVLSAGDVQVTQYQKRGTTITANVSAAADSELTFPLFGFDGYAAEVDGQRLSVSLGENNRLAVSLPAGTQGQLKVWFAGKGYWRVFDAVSLLTLVGLCARGVLRAKSRRTLTRRAKDAAK